MVDKNTVAMYILLAGISTPVLLPLAGLLFAAFGYVIRYSLDSLQRAQERLAPERRRLYADLLEPYIKVFAGIKQGGNTSEVEKLITSEAYRRTASEVVLIGSDEVVNCYSDLMQFTYESSRNKPIDHSSRGYEMLRLYGLLLLAIRKSLGGGSTGLGEWDMLRHMINDLDELVAAGTIKPTRYRRHRMRDAKPGRIEARMRELEEEAAKHPPE